MKTIFADHNREFENNLYTYPVISRRSRGLSIGINLSLIQECNFDCVYCQVDRTNTQVGDRNVNLDILKNELINLIEKSISGEIYQNNRFKNAIDEYKVLKDIAFSGEGEPTASLYFVQATNLVIDLIDLYKTKGHIIQPIVITNATLLHKEDVSNVLRTFYEKGGGAWIKLDAGTEAEYKFICDTRVPYQRVIENIYNFSVQTPSILQTCLFYTPENHLSFSIEDYCNRVKEMLKKGAKFQSIQLYTLARNTRLKDIKPLEQKSLEFAQNQIQENTRITVHIFP